MRPKPEESVELQYLKDILRRREEEDFPDDLQAAFYRNLSKVEPAKFQAQKQKAEEKFRAELDAWYREKDAEDKLAANEAKAVKANGPKKGKDIGTARCLEMLDKLIGTLTGVET